MLSFRSVLEQTSSSSRVLEHTCAALPLTLSHVTFIQNIGGERAREAMVSISIAADQTTLVKKTRKGYHGTLRKCRIRRQTDDKQTANGENHIKIQQIICHDLTLPPETQSNQATNHK
eukprot:sb/3476410/